MWTLTRLAFAVGTAGSTSTLAARDLTPADTVETTRFLQNQELPGHAIDENFASPSGKRYLVRTAYGDVRRNGVWVDFWTGSLESLTAATPRRCAHLFSTGLGSRADEYGANLDPISANLVKWTDDHEIAFLWTDKHEVRQVMAVDLKNCQHRQLTHEATTVTSFVVGAHHRVLINVRRPKLEHSGFRWEDGFTLPEAANGWSVLRDEISDRTFSETNQETNWSVVSGRGRRPIQLMGSAVDPTIPLLRPLTKSPNGHFAITYSGVRVIPEAWRAYTDSSLQQTFAANLDSPGAIPVMFVVIDLMTASSRAVWNAPMGHRPAVAFSPDNTTLLMAPTFLPAGADDPAGLAGHAAAVVDLHSGSYEVLPIDLARRGVALVSWDMPGRVSIRSQNADRTDFRIDRFRRLQGRWVQDTEPPATIASSAVKLQLRQSLNVPPTLWAVASDGRERRLMDPNPHLRENFRLGFVERRSGKLVNGHAWLAQLIYPADYRPGTRYPLVIQSVYGHPWREEEFTLNGAWGGSGMGLGPSEFPSYPGQLLASRGIAVLQLESQQSLPELENAKDHQLLFESLSEDLSASGLVDRARIALSGFSFNGYWVDYTLTHSLFPFAAALTADNYDAGYMTSALTDWWSWDVEANGAPAFGSGLQSWLLNSPGFNAEHIHTPLRMIGQAMGGVPYFMGKWELYSRLRHLQRPVEIAVMPDINRHPSHNTQNPRQIIAIQESSLDWLSFWLIGREDPSPLKREQYLRWHRLRKLQSLTEHNLPPR